ncbi:RNA polymerase sigma factor [Sphingobacterium multivorum]|jgi:RNA polymerase sigma-70 factor (ECF subfamily)|uniref:RNA polymerase sigma factor n=1 Tax=Sphingobacterium TaxID=28453 RepID=UPI00284CD2B6|nr:sigma-70 family RNA polymerase sigma factor [Sphingobacterium sp.]MDR3010334.1 sigma-70 family RNA polymerase sigma factor [Sphingobacterium sp.]
MFAFKSSKIDTPQDHELLLHYQESMDLQVLGDLFQRHTEMVYYVCLRYLQDSELSKDAVMNIFEELIYKVNKQEIKDFPRWLYVLSKNHCLMYLRSQKNKSQISLDEFVKFPGDMHQYEQYDEKEEQLTAMEGCLGKLPEKQQQSVRLFFLEEKCYKEISESTGYSLNEVKSYIQNGKRNLKNCMEAWNEQQ